MRGSTQLDTGGLGQRQPAREVKLSTRSQHIRVIRTMVPSENSEPRGSNPAFRARVRAHG